MIRLLLLFSICFISLKGIAQNEADSSKYARWNLSPYFGYYFGSIGSDNENLGDNLIYDISDGLTWQFLAADVYLNRNWGLSVAFPMFSIPSSTQRIENIEQDLLGRFGDQYFVKDTEMSFDNSFIMAQALVGPVYRVEKGNYYLQSKIMFGISDVRYGEFSAYLKQRDSHQVLYYELESDGKYTYNVVPSILFGYRVSPRFIFNLNVQYNYMIIDAEVIDTISNVFTDEVLSEIPISYSRTAYGLGLSFGLIVEFSRKMRAR